MKYKLANGQLVGEYQAFTYNDIQYPENWIALSTDEERQALGIQEFAEQPRPDDRFYFVTDNGDGTYSTVAKDMNDGDEYVDLRGVTRRVQGLKSQYIEQIKATANSLMAPTDWMVLRQLFKGIGMSALVENYRDAVVAEANRLETAILATTTVDELITALGTQNWPKNP